jgi:pyrroline-5-carboxylate reductase
MSNIIKLKIGFIGGGKMAEAIIKGLKDSGARNITVSDRAAKRKKYLKSEYKVKTAKNNKEVVTSSDAIVLAVKPADIKKVCGEIKEGVERNKMFISVAAGIASAFIRYQLGTDRVVRVMPNTPAFVGKGMTVIATSPRTTKKDINTTEKIFTNVGDVLVMDEKNIDAVTAISGSGPAFVSLFVESLVDGAVRMGIQRNDALKLALKTVDGSVAMLENGLSTAKLKHMVTSPGGTTAEGLFVLEREGFKGLVVDAVESARERASELAHQIEESSE